MKLNKQTKKYFFLWEFALFKSHCKQQVTFLTFTSEQVINIKTDMILGFKVAPEISFYKKQILIGLCQEVMPQGTWFGGSFFQILKTK